MLTPKDINKLKKMRYNFEAAAKEFNKSPRTIRRWLKKYHLYEPKSKYKPGKLSKEKAAEIRQLSKEMTQIELAKKFNVSQATIGRIINNVIYKEGLTLKGTAIIQVKI